MQTSNQNKPLSDNIRKLALAAKSGQMQLNNLPNENNIFL